MAPSLEWNSPVFVTFVDYEKAFDSIDRVAYAARWLPHEIFHNIP